MIHNLDTLKRVANQACERVLAERCVDDAFNKADLRCVTAERYENDLGETGYRVYLEEAAPEAVELRRFVCDHLATAGYPGVEVITEW